jgi:hypothetical protein
MATFYVSLDTNHVTEESVIWQTYTLYVNPDTNRVVTEGERDRCGALIS